MLKGCCRRRTEETGAGYPEIAVSRGSRNEGAESRLLDRDAQDAMNVQFPRFAAVACIERSLWTSLPTL